MEVGRRGVRGATAVRDVSRALRDAQGPAIIRLLSMEERLASESRHSGFRAPYYAQVGVKLLASPHGSSTNYSSPVEFKTLLSRSPCLFLNGIDNTCYTHTTRVVVIL